MKEKNTNLMGHKRIKVSIMHVMLGYFLANYSLGGLGVCLSGVQPLQY